VQTLASSKESLMGLYPTVSNDVYNRVAKVAYGIIGQESSFGSYGGLRGQAGRVTDNLQLAYNEIGGERNPSIGLGQIRITTVPKKAKEAFSINDPSDLKNPDKNAQAVMASLLDAYVNQIKNSQKENLEQILPVIHSNQRALVKKANEGKDISQNSYVKSVNDKSKELTVYLGESSKSKKQKNKKTPGGSSIVLLGLSLATIRKRRREGSITNSEALSLLKDRLSEIDTELENLNLEQQQQNTSARLGVNRKNKVKEKYEPKKKAKVEDDPTPDIEVETETNTTIDEGGADWILERGTDKNDVEYITSALDPISGSNVSVNIAYNLLDEQGGDPAIVTAIRQNRNGDTLVDYQRVGYNEVKGTKLSEFVSLVDSTVEPPVLGSNKLNQMYRNNGELGFLGHYALLQEGETYSDKIKKQNKLISSVQDLNKRNAKPVELQLVAFTYNIVLCRDE